MANQEPLTLGDIFELRLNQCRLVTLSACETGLIDLKSISDEYIGLPSGFLFAGSSTVVSSLWQVDDLSTSFLMIKFYENLKHRPYLQQGDVAIALKQAQNWLRTLTHEDCQKFKAQIQEFNPNLGRFLRDLDPRKLSVVDSFSIDPSESSYPFENPYYWAGFIATGI